MACFVFSRRNSYLIDSNVTVLRHGVDWLPMSEQNCMQYLDALKFCLTFCEDIPVGEGRFSSFFMQFFCLNSGTEKSECLTFLLIWQRERTFKSNHLRRSEKWLCSCCEWDQRETGPQLTPARPG